MRKGQYKNKKPFDRKEYMKTYNSLSYQKNHEKELERSKKYRKLNPEKVKVARKNWYDKNGVSYRTEHMKELSRNNVKYAKKKRKTDITYNLKCMLRNRFITAIKRQYGKKAFKTIDLIGCSIKEAREHLESQFEPWMTWENHGEWEIDHIIPVSLFDLTIPEEQKKAFNYKNLQPLSWQENQRKYNKLPIG
jgi:5-methylcytosine-specific restriction endonuclease McrA